MRCGGRNEQSLAADSWEHVISVVPLLPRRESSIHVWW